MLALLLDCLKKMTPELVTKYYEKESLTETQKVNEETDFDVGNMEDQSL